MCSRCRSIEVRWEVTSGRGRIWSFIVPHPPLLPAFAEVAPYNAIIVELEEDPLIRFAGNLVTGADGEINEHDKTTFLGEAAALLFPIDWPEPFGLVMIEAMACGTPVLAFRRGSVPEVIDQDITGYVVDDIAGAIAAVPKLLQLDRRRVREQFDERFTAARMAKSRIADVARASWQNFGAVIFVDHLDQAPTLVDRLAPEHLQIATSKPEALAARIRNAGALFLGRYTPEVIGDYVGGTNHVLPTARSARFASGLSVLDFMKRTSILKLDAASLKALGPAAMTLATAEGLEAHRRSVAIRLNAATPISSSSTIA